MSFEQFSFDGKIAAAVHAAGYTTPTPIQEQAIPVVLEGKDVLGLAQTGTGKTAAFVLPMLQRFGKSTLKQPRGLIVAPTRELAEQIHQTIVDLGKQTKIRSFTIYGGVGKTPQVDALRRGADIIVACPGRLLDLIGDGVVNLTQIEVLVLDEADRMCDMGFLPDIRRLLRHVPKNRQTLFFSATMPSDIRELADEILRDPVTVQVDIIAPAKTVSHALYPVSDGLKNRFLFSLLKQTPTGRVLIFTRTKRRARNLALDLENQGYRVAALQGNMAQNRRQEAIDGFREGDYDILVATDIAARGIDVTAISHVINFDMPDTVDAYTHRIGRTGRAELTGEAFTFSTPTDDDVVYDIEKVLGKRIERRRLTGFDYSGFNPDQQSSRSQTRSGQSTRQGQPAKQGQFQQSQARPVQARPTQAQPSHAQPAHARAELTRSGVNQQGQPKQNQAKSQPAKAKGKKRKPPISLLTIRPDEWILLNSGESVRETISIPVRAPVPVREPARETSQDTDRGASRDINRDASRNTVNTRVAETRHMDTYNPDNRPAKSSRARPHKSVSLQTLRHRFFRHQQHEVAYPEEQKEHD